MSTPDCLVVVPVHNRPYYTAMALPMILADAAACSRVRDVYLVDDRSRPPTRAVLDALAALPKVHRVQLPAAWAASSTGALRWLLDHAGRGLDPYETPYIAKVDNDILIPHGYFAHLLNLLDLHPDLGFVGMRESPTYPICAAYDEIVPARFIGGVGVFRTLALQSAPMPAYQRFFGFTELQEFARRCGWRAAWTSTSTNTNLDASPWSCVDSYVQTGDGRKLVIENQAVWSRPPFDDGGGRDAP